MPEGDWARLLATGFIRRVRAADLAMMPSLSSGLPILCVNEGA